MPFGPYKSWEECIAKNGDKSDPAAFCAWMEHETTGKWPAEHMAELPLQARVIYYESFSATMKKGQGEVAAHSGALAALNSQGWTQSKTGWIQQFQAAKTRTIKGVEVFAAGVWTDSRGQTREWKAADLEKMITAFKGGQGFVLKVGHTSDSFNKKIAQALGLPLELVTGEAGIGQIALGNGSDLSLVNGKLIADFVNVPETIADLIEGHQFNHVSAEIEPNGDKPLLTAVALLGVEEPAVNSLAPLAAAGVFSRTADGMTIVNFKYAKEGHVAQEDIQEQMSTLSRLLALFGKKHPKEEPKMKFTLTQEDLPKLYGALGLPLEATIDQVLAAIQGLKVQTPAPGAPGMMSEEQKTQFASFQSRVTALESENTSLKHAKRVADYLTITSRFTAVAGKPEDIAAQLASIEEKTDKATADQVLATYRASDEAGKVATRLLGHTKRDEGEGSFEGEVLLYTKANPTLSRADAIKAVMRSNPELYHNSLEQVAP